MTQNLPGVTFTRVAPKEPPSPLRSDVAGFLVRTRRGDVGRAVRIDGWRAFLHEFGGLDARFDGPYAVRGYFDNGGQIAHIVRVLAEPFERARGVWNVDEFLGSAVHSELGLFHDRYELTAKSPGTWAEGLRVEFSYLRYGLDGEPEVDVRIEPVGEAAERFVGLSPAALSEQVTTQSRYVSMRVLVPRAPGPSIGGPLRIRFAELELSGGSEPEFGSQRAYTDAAQALFDVPEVALVAAPDLHRELPDRDSTAEWLRRGLTQADRLLDRMWVLDPPFETLEAAEDSARQIHLWRTRVGPPGLRGARAAAVYAPYLSVLDPLGGVQHPIRRIPACGHVAGVISRLDRERGAHHTPANARLIGAVGLEGEPEESILPRLFEEAVNLLRCHPRDGLVVWGGRTLAFAPSEGGFVAHRRLIHRLVRAIHRVAEPLVFEENGPLLWLTFGRAITTVLVTAYRAGALKGKRPEEAFRVQCDEETNPPEQRDQGLCLCLVQLAPAVPMEFIELRVGLSRDGTLEVIVP